MVKGMHARLLEVDEAAEWESRRYESRRLAVLSEQACPVCRNEARGPGSYRVYSVGAVLHTWDSGCLQFRELSDLVGAYMSLMNLNLAVNPAVNLAVRP